MTSIDLNRLRIILLEAGKIITEGFHHPQQLDAKGDGSPLTVTDTRCNEYLKTELMRLIPSAGWLSEESKEDPKRLDRHLVWVVDPLDGTKEFIRHIPELAISIGLVEKGKAIAGAVLNPITQEGGICGGGQKATFWGFETSPKRNIKKLMDATVSLSRTEIEDGSVTPYVSLFGKTQSVGSVAYKLLRVAAGADDATFSIQHKSEWDICGGVALLNSVGFVYDRLDHQALKFNQKSPRIKSGAVAGSKAIVELVHRALATSHSKVG
jgi:myo-inositol-1(or 4)-monophosphatase